MPVTPTSAAKDRAEKARLACTTPGSAVYRRRRPERSLLYRTVQKHLATWLALHDDGAGCSISGVTECQCRMNNPQSGRLKFPQVLV